MTRIPRKLQFSFAALATGALAVGITLLTGASGKSSAAPESQLEALHSQSLRPSDRDRDTLPVMLSSSDNASRLDLESSRFLASTTSGNYWSVLNNDGKICLIVEQTSEHVVAGGCQTLETFAEVGIWLAFQGQDRVDGGLVAYLLPDPARPGNVPTAAERAAPNLLEIRNANAGVEAFSVITSDVSVTFPEVKEYVYTE